MNGLHSLLFQKGKRTTSAHRIATDMLEEFGFVCTDIGFPFSGKTKDVTTTNWKDRDGEDVYIPTDMRVEAFDLKVGICHSGNIGESENRIRRLVDFLRVELPTDGSGIMIWSELYKRGFCKCYLKDVGDFEYTYLSRKEVLECTLTFRVTAPHIVVKLNKDTIGGNTGYHLSYNE